LNKQELGHNWEAEIGAEFDKNYMQVLTRFLEKEYQAGKVIYPARPDIFNAFKLTDFDQVKVVILGQDPYHGPGQAQGLSFSVPITEKIPPSLRNIYKEINRDLALPPPAHGNLFSWAEQGVFLLNSTLTVEQSKAGSHRGHGWEEFTDVVICTLSQRRRHLVFLLWGSHAIGKKHLIDASKHLILSSPHPSPLSAHRGFLGNSHFSSVNNYLKQHNQSPINWSVPEEQQSLF